MLYSRFYYRYLHGFGQKMAQGFGQKNGFCLCYSNSVVSRDLIVKEVSEMNGIVRIVVRSVCKQF